MSPEEITPGGDSRSKGEQVEAMFDNIAPSYDLLNRAMTLGIDRNWRRKAVLMATTHAPGRVLDVACGTADMAIQIARTSPGTSVHGIDLSENMLAIGRDKVKSAGLEGRITLTKGDCLALPFADGTFDAVTVAYGVRNFERLEQGYAEIRRVLKPGGILCVLELSVPSNPVIKSGYDIYTRGIIPLLGRLVAGNSSAYTYLPRSIAAMPKAGEMLALMRRVGFNGCRHLPLTLGVCSIFTGIKPMEANKTAPADN